MEGTISRRWTRSQALQKRLLDAAACGDKVADTSTPSPSPPPKPQPAKISRVSTRRTKVQPSELVPQPADEIPAQYLPQPKPPSPPQSQPQPSSALPYDANLRYMLLLNWLESVGTHRNLRYCRSDSHLRPPTTNNTHIPRHTATSVPAMSPGRNVNPLLVKALHGSNSMVDTNERSDYPFDSSLGTAQHDKDLVKQPDYRELNLDVNNISMRGSLEELPGPISKLVDLICQVRDTHTIAEIKVFHTTWLGCFGEQGKAITEPSVQAYFQQHIFPAQHQKDCLQRDEKIQMSRQIIPTNTTAPDSRVSIPTPDVLYGYNGKNGFPDQYFHMGPLLKEVKATNTTSLYPFLIFKFKGDGGSMWVATNQCLGAAASSVNLAEDLNNRLRQCGSNKTINSTIFSIACNGTEARLYVSWKHEKVKYYTAIVRGFLLYNRNHYIELYNCIHNILGWGRGKRLEELREAMDVLLEEGRKRASEAAKSRAPPSSDSTAGRMHKRLKNMPRKKPTKTATTTLPRRSQRLRR